MRDRIKNAFGQAPDAFNVFVAECLGAQAAAPAWHWRWAQPLAFILACILMAAGTAFALTTTPVRLTLQPPNATPLPSCASIGTAMAATPQGTSALVRYQIDDIAYTQDGLSFSLRATPLQSSSCRLLSGWESKQATPRHESKPYHALAIEQGQALLQVQPSILLDGIPVPASLCQWAYEGPSLIFRLQLRYPSDTPADAAVVCQIEETAVEPPDVSRPRPTAVPGVTLQLVPHVA